MPLFRKSSEREAGVAKGVNRNPCERNIQSVRVRYRNIKAAFRAEVAVLAASSLLFILGADAVQANNLKSFLKDNDFEVGGWINGGATYNANNPSDGFNGTVTFADQANRFQLNQLNFFLQRTVPSEGADWGIGGRFDFLFGTDAIYTQAFGISAFDENTGEPSNRGNWISTYAASRPKPTESRFPTRISRLISRLETG